MEKELHLVPNQSTVDFYHKEKWHSFAEKNQVEKKKNGVYFPGSFQAHIKISEYTMTDTYHEYFGHGIYCEHSIPGQQISILDNNGEIEKTQLMLEQFEKQYEGFALWTEYFLTKHNEQESQFVRKLEGLDKYLQEVFVTFYDFVENNGTLALRGELQLPKFYDTNNIQDLVTKYHKKEDIKLAILYGSQKPYSDIDLFIVTKNKSKGNFYNGWVDIGCMDEKEFQHRYRQLDISITDPLFTGVLIIGDQNELDSIKEEILRLPITSAIKQYQEQMIKQIKETIKSYPVLDKRYNDCLSYIQSFNESLQALKQGIKKLRKVER